MKIILEPLAPSLPLLARPEQGWGQVGRHPSHKWQMQGLPGPGGPLPCLAGHSLALGTLSFIVKGSPTLLLGRGKAPPWVVLPLLTQSTLPLKGGGGAPGRAQAVQSSAFRLPSLA